MTQSNILQPVYIVTKQSIIETSTHSLGGGEWSIEVRANGEFVKEFIGSNGTQEPAHDLWAEYEEWYENLPNEQIWEYE